MQTAEKAGELKLGLSPNPIQHSAVHASMEIGRMALIPSKV